MSAIGADAPVVRRDLRSIQFLRFVAAAIVVVDHSAHAVSKHFPDSLAPVQKFLGLGASGVSIFFVISGFVMVHTSFGVEGRAFSPPQFILRRFARIYPIYILYAAVYLAFYQSYGEMNLSPWEISGSLLLLPGYSSNIIGPGWTLSFEIYFYICFAIFMSLGLTRGLMAMTLFFLLSIALRLLFVPNDQFSHLVTNPRLVEFLFGAWIAFFMARVAKVDIRIGYFALGLALVGFCIGILGSYSKWPALLAWGIPSAFLVVGFVIYERSGEPFRIVTRLSFLGDSSYSLYLLHIIIVDWFFMLVAERLNIGSLNPTLLALLVAFFSTAVAVLAYNLIESRLTSAAQQIVRRVFR